MVISEIRDIALSLKGATEDIKWENHLCFNVGGKMFLVTNPEISPSTASFRVSSEDFEELIQQTGFSKHQYLGRYYWVHLDDVNRLVHNEWENYINNSYRIVASKLSVKLRKQLQIELP